MNIASVRAREPAAPLLIPRPRRWLAHVRVAGGQDYGSSSFQRRDETARSTAPPREAATAPAGDIGRGREREPTRGRAWEAPEGRRSSADGPRTPRTPSKLTRRQPRCPGRRGRGSRASAPAAGDRGCHTGVLRRTPHSSIDECEELIDAVAAPSDCRAAAPRSGFRRDPILDPVGRRAGADRRSTLSGAVNDRAKAALFPGIRGLRRRSPRTRSRNTAAPDRRARSRPGSTWFRRRPAAVPAGAEGPSDGGANCDSRRRSWSPAAASAPVRPPARCPPTGITHENRADLAIHRGSDDVDAISAASGWRRRSGPPPAASGPGCHFLDIAGQRGGDRPGWRRGRTPPWRPRSRRSPAADPSPARPRARCATRPGPRSSSRPGGLVITRPPLACRGGSPACRASAWPPRGR